MRQFRLPIILTVAALAVTACVPVTPMPGQPPVTTTTPPPVATTPTVLDAASRAVARTAINAQMANRLPANLVAPATDCVVANATTAELIDIAQMTNAGTSGVDGSVLAIVKRPGTTQCIAAAGTAAKAAT